MSAPTKFVAGKDPDGIPNQKSGTVFTASLHCFCAIVGAGVLALPYSVAWLGWVAGPTLIVIFYLISLLTSRMLSDVYEVNGIEHGRYHHCVRHILGRGSAIAVSVFQLINIFLITIAYSITAASAMRHVADVACLIQGTPNDQCWHQTWKLTLIFGASEVILSQIRNLEEAWWISAVGSFTSIMYSLIALIISLAHAGNHEGDVAGIRASDAGKAFGILNALGSISFAYSFSLILLEIEDTLRQPPRAATTMKKACNVAITASFIFYLLVAVAGYLARGNDVSPMILAAYDSPRWAIILANICVVLHMVTAYQVFAQPMFDTLESWVKAWLLKRQRRKAGLEDGKGGDAGERAAIDVHAAPGPPQALHVPVAQVDTAARHAGGPPPSPFDAPAPAAPRVATAEPHIIDEGRDALGLSRISLPPLEARLSSPGLSQRFSQRMSAAPGSGGLGPIDERRASATTSVHVEPNFLSRLSQLSAVSALNTQLSRLSQAAAMYAVDTGFTNEKVPLNEDRYYAPFVLRLAVRSLYVGIITLIAIIMPFFSAFAGLVGALTFFPLAVYFPLACYRRVYPVSRPFSALLWVIWVSMLLVCSAATIAACRNIITGWSNYKIFGD